MSSTPEKLVKKQIIEVLKKFGAYYFYPVTSGYGSSGVPDIVCCYKGLFVAIEVKAGKNKTTALQDKAIAAIRAAEGVALVTNETNVDQVTAVLRAIDEWGSYAAEYKLRPYIRLPTEGIPNA